MNELNCNSICHLLCCPPVPSKIAAKLAFMPPPPSYELSASSNNPDKLSFTYASFMRDSFIAVVPENLEATTAVTRRGNKIAIIYMRMNPTSKLTFLLSHGNAIDLGLMVTFMHELGTKLNVNMMCYDYSGYGASTGKPLEKNLYADAECALNVLQTKFNVPLRQVVLYGQSIGTVPTVHLATMHRVAAVVLHSPLMSGLRVAFPRLRRNYCCDVFSNLTRASRILSPTLIIHGTRDDVVHVHHGQRICSALAEHLVLDPLFIEGAGHNDCEMFPQYLIRLAKLTNVEIPQMDEKVHSLETLMQSPSGDEPRMQHKRPSTFTPTTTSSESSTTESDTDLSPPSSTAVSQDLLDTTSVDRAKRKRHSSFRKISPLLAEQLRLLLSRRTNALFRKLSTRSVRSNPSTESQVPTSFCPKRSCAEALSAPQQIGCETLPVCVAEAQLNSIDTTEAEVPVTQTISEHSDTDEDSKNKSFEEELVDLPPPPPPPPDKKGLLESNELLWNVHQSKCTKRFTLPRELSHVNGLKTKSKSNQSLSREKPSTLPMFSPHIPSASDDTSDSPPTALSSSPETHLASASASISPVLSTKSLPTTEDVLIPSTTPSQPIST